MDSGLNVTKCSSSWEIAPKNEESPECIFLILEENPENGSQTGPKKLSATNAF